MPANYYRTQSAIRYLDRIRVPVLLIQAKDDTFIPFRDFRVGSGAVKSRASSCWRPNMADISVFWRADPSAFGWIQR